MSNCSTQFPTTYIRLISYPCVTVGSPAIKSLVFMSFTQYPAVKITSKLKCSLAISLPAYHYPNFINMS